MRTQNKVLLVHMFVCMYETSYVCIASPFVHAYVGVCMDVCVYNIHMYVFSFCLNVCTNRCTYVCICVPKLPIRLCVCMYLHTHVRIEIPTWPL